MNRIVEIDQAMEVAINSCHAPWADTFFWYVSQSWVWIPLYGLMIGLLFYRYGYKKAIWMVLALIAVAGLSDWISSGCIKPMVMRWRPTHEPTLQGLIHVVHGYAGGRFGFVSSHAANTMSVALLFSLIWRKRTTTLLMMLWVALVCYSRMYLGVHYPGDILGGWVVGASVGWIGYMMLRLTKIVRHAI